MHEEASKTIVHADVADCLKSDIARGQLEPGQRLVEIRLCERFGVGRTKIREALKTLETEGFVKIIPNIGALVLELSQKEIEQIYDLIGTLEGLAVRVSTPHIAEEEIDELERLVQEMEASGDLLKFFHWNMKFHTFLDQLSENSRLVKFNQNIRAQANRISLRSFYNPGQINASLKEHRRILSAIKKRDPAKAEKAIRKHYLQSKNRLVKYLNKSL
jgi:DNA-binding GntR family transcriptional regulator